MQNKALRRTNFLKMDLQRFAEGGTDGVEAGASGTGAEGGSDDSPSYDDLVAELARERAEKEKLKTATDNACREAAEYKRKYRSKMTAEEQISDEQRLQAEAREKEINDMKTELATIKATKRYMRLKMDESFAEETAKAEIAGDMDAVVANFEKHIKSIEEQVRISVLGERGTVHAGHGEDNEPESVRIAKQLQGSGRKSANTDILKNFYLNR